ncbi:MAG TPA: TonB-dependent receptor [Gemmatimonadales bacterium]|nr:TonB-dependent receptor [Gemmatimonadales bacterium]
MRPLRRGLFVVLCLLPLVAPFLAAQERMGTITGRVVDSRSEAGIASATVELVDGGRTVVSTETGRFTLTDVPVGTWRLRATAIGFEPVVLTDILVGTGKPLEIDLRLAPAVVRLQELAAETTPYFQPSLESATSQQSLGTEEIRRAPGVQEDPVRAVALLPGVGVTTGGRNDLVVRGGAPFENLFLVDGIEVPNINHFGSQGSTGGPVSLLNIDFVREAAFSSGGYGVTYGDRTASFTNLSLREGNAQRLAGEVNLSATGFGFIGEGPLGRNGTFLASVRRSYLDLLFKAAGFAFIPEYWDGQVKLTQRFGRRDALSFLAVGAIDNFKFNNETADNRFDNSRIAAPTQRSYFSGLTWRRSLERGVLAVTLGRTWTTFDVVQNDSLEAPLYRNRSTEGDNSLRTDLTLEVARDVQLTIGNTARFASRLRYEVALAGDQRRDSLGVPAPLAVDTSFTAFRNATYAQGVAFLGAVRVSAGVRGDWYEFLDAYRVAPRVGVNVPVGRSGSVNLSAGRYYQAPQFIWLVGDPGNTARLTPIRADQLVAGYERLFRADLKAQLEVYYKDYGAYPTRLFRPQAVLQPSGFDDVSADIPAGLEPLGSSGVGRSYGVEFFLQKRLSTSPFYGFLSLSLNRTEFTALDGIERSGSFETRAIGNVLAGWRPNAKWEVSGKFRIASGLPYTPYATSGPDTGELDFAAYNANRLPTFHALDVRVDRRWAFRGTQLDLYLDVQNVYNRENVSGVYWDERTQQQEFNSQLGLLPTIGVNLEF